MSRRVPRSRVTHDRWLISYADFITLLFGLFVVLFAFAKADQKKQVQVTQSIDSAFRSLGLFPGAVQHPSLDTIPGEGPIQPPNAMNTLMRENIVSPDQVRNDLSRLNGELLHSLAGQIAAHTVSIHMGRDGLVISLREAGFFASGSATPMPETLATLRRIAASLARTPYDLRVEGHTDNIPIHTAEFDSNWELSTARATRIARVLLDLKAMTPGRISAAGYAQFHPVASNNSEPGRAENRRVDLVVLPSTKIDFSTPAIPNPSGPWRKITDDR
jgi:chemotaxis protein MotB